MTTAAAIAAIAAIATAEAWASPCARPDPRPERCASYLLAEADLTLPVLERNADRRIGVQATLGWMVRLDGPWEAAPLISIGYESESGAAAAIGARLRRRVRPMMFVDLGVAARLVAADRSASRTGGGSLELGISFADWAGVAARVDVVRIGDRWAPALLATARLGSYPGLAVGVGSVLLVWLLQSVSITS